MRNIVRFAQLALVPGFALMTGGIAPAAMAKDGDHHNAHLRGAYAFTTARTCTVIQAPGNPFGPPPFAIPSPLPPGAGLFRQSTTDAGITTFNGDGTATSTGRSRTMNINAAGGAPVSVSEFTSAINYTVNPDGTVDTETSSAFTIVFPSVPTPTTGTVTNQTGRLQITRRKNILVSAPSEDPTVETVVLTPAPPGIPFTQSRICVRSTILTKLPNDD